MPALRFLLALLLAAIGVAAAAALSVHAIGAPLDLRLAVALHGAGAALLCRRAGLAWWWVASAAVFAPLAWVASAWPVPAWVWAAALAAGAGIFAGVVRTRVPLYLSGRATWAAVEALLPQGPIRIIDAGAGLGGLIAHLAARRPDARVEGVELAPLTWLACWLRLRCTGSRAGVRLGDIAGIDVADYDVIFAFLSPEPMPALHARAMAGMRPGGMLISCEFAVPGHAPERRIEVPGGRPLLVWTAGRPG